MISHKQTHKDHKDDKVPQTRTAIISGGREGCVKGDVMMVTLENITIYTSMFVNIIEPIGIQVANLI